MKILNLFLKSKKENNLELNTKMNKDSEIIKYMCNYHELLNKLKNDNQTELTKEYLLKVRRTSISDLNKKVKSFQINKIHYDYLHISLKFEIINNRYNSCLMYFDDLKSMIDFDLKK